MTSVNTMDVKGKPKDYYNRPFPEPFNSIPPPVLDRKPGQLPAEQIKEYFNEVNDFKT